MKNFVARSILFKFRHDLETFDLYMGMTVK